MESAQPVGSDILSKTQVVVIVYLYTVFHVALGWTTIIGSYTVTLNIYDLVIMFEENKLISFM